MRKHRVWLIALLALIAACSSNEQGGLRLLYSWTDSEGNDITPPDMGLLYAWAELKYGEESKTAGPVWMGSDQTGLRFENLPYGPTMTLTITMRFIDGAGSDEDIIGTPSAPKESTDNIAYRCTSQGFSLERGKVTEVQNACVMEPTAGVDPETGKPTVPELRVFDLDGTELPAERESTRHDEVTLCYQAPNATQVHIANDADFTGSVTVTIPAATGGACPDGYHAYEHWSLGAPPDPASDRAPRVVYLKASDDLGAETKPTSQKLFVDNKAPVIVNQVLSPTAANGTSLIRLALSFQEPVVSVTLDDGALSFERIAPLDDQQLFVYEHQVNATDTEGNYPLAVTAVDAAGNSAAHDLTDTITIDKTSPGLTYAIEKNGVPVEETAVLYLRDEDALSVSLILSETPKETPRLLLGTYPLLCTQGADTEHYDCLLTVDKATHDEGIADLTAAFEDTAGNPYAAPLKAGIRLDYTAPSFTFKKSKEGTYNATDQIVLTVTANETLFAVTVNGVEQNTDAISWNITGANTTGDHEVTAGATDLAGNSAAEAVIGDYTVDATYPAATIGAPTPERIAAGATATVTVSDPTEPITAVILNGVACTGSGPYTCTFTAPSGTGDKVETLTISYADAAGNTVTENAGTVYIDRTAPTLTAQIVPGDKTLNASETLQITINASETLTTAPTVVLLKDGSTDPIVPSDTDIQGLTYIYTYPTLADGTYGLTADGSDTVGLPATQIAVSGIVSDSSIPEVTGAVTIFPERIKPGAETTISFTADEPMNDPGDSVVVKVGGTTTTCSSGDGLTYHCTYTGTAGTQDSIETISITLTDASANTTTSTHGTVYLDRTAPVLTLKKNKSDTYNKNDQILLSISSTEELSELTINGVIQSDPVGLSWDLVPDTSDGTHTIIATAQDKAGNPTAVSLTDSYEVDATDPTADISAPTPNRVPGNTAVTFTVTKTAGGEELIDIKVRNNDGSFSDCPGGACTYTTAIGTAGEDTQETLTVTYADAAGNTVTENAGTVYVDRTAPMLTAQIVPGDKTLNASETLQITINASETLTTAPTVVLLKDGSTDPIVPSDTDIQGLTYIYTYPTLADGTYGLTADGSDTVGLPATQIAVSGIVSDSSIPEVTGAVTVLPERIKPGADATITFTADEPMNDPGDSVVVKVGGTTTTCTTTDGTAYECTYTGTAGTQDSIETISITLTDASANGTTSTHGTVYVDRTAPQMVSKLITPDKAKEGAVVEVVVAFDEPVTDVVFGGGGLLFTRTDDGSNAQRFSYEYEVLGSEDEKAYALTLVANDAAGNPVADTAIGSLTIDLTAPAIADLRVCHDDATDDPCAADEITFSAVTGYKEMKISFSLAETADDLTVELDDTDITTGNCTAYAGPSYVCTATVIDPASGLDPRMEGLLAQVTTGDDAGNGDFDSKSIVYDFLPPDVGGTVTIVLTRPSGCPIASDDLSRVTYGTLVEAFFSVNEELEGGAPLTVLTDKDGLQFPFVKDSSAGYFYIYRTVVPPSGIFLQGEYALKVTLRDAVGNERTATPPMTAPGFYLDTEGPADPAVATPGVIIYRRIPWGSEETAGVRYFSLVAAAVDGTDPVDGSTAYVVAFDGAVPATASQLGIQTASGGTFPEMELSRADRTTVFLAAYDTACNRSAALAVKDVEWTATMGYKVPGSTMENPNVFSKTPHWDPRLTQDPTITRELSGEEVRHLGTTSGTPFIEQAEQRWSELVGTGEGPETRVQHAMVYDSGRGTVVLFGGYTDVGPSDEVWEYDGRTGQWTDRTPIVGPGPRFYHAMAYDSARGVVVMFSGGDGTGFMQDTWEWDGNAGTWTDRTPEVMSPAGRYNGTMAYDSLRRKVVLFGGFTGSPRNDIWDWDGEEGTWTPRYPNDPPSGRVNAKMVYDQARGRMVLFGGAASLWEPKGYMNEIWDWDGTYYSEDQDGVWTQRTKPDPALKPEKRENHALAYDQARGRVVLFGGWDGAATYNDIWEWNGVTGDWEERFPVGSLPDAVFFHTMAYDRSRGKSMIFGGRNESNTIGLLWEWDGAVNTWTARMPDGVKPSPRSFVNLAYDSDRGKVVLFGGHDGHDQLDDTWEWDCATGRWSDETPGGTGPVARAGHTLAYDRDRKVTLLFGGYDGTDAYQDTWEWNGNSWHKRMDPTDCGVDPTCTVCTATTCPSPRWTHAMAYDESEKSMIVFGGYDYNNLPALKPDTWEWDGISGVWTDRTPSPSPSARSNHAMTFDRDRKRILMYGGSSDDSVWEWDGFLDRWIEHPFIGSDGPGTRNRHALTYDRDRDTLLLFSGPTNEQDIWEWDPETTLWKERTPSGIKPAARERGAMVYDTAHGRAVLFGGDNGPELNDTWAWDGSTDGRPAGLLAVPFSRAQATMETMVSLAVSFVTGASAYSTPGEDGARLMAWDTRSGEWRTLDDNDNAAGDPDLVYWYTDDVDEILTLMYGSQQTFNFAVMPVNSNGTAAQLSEVAVTYAEVVVRYRIGQ